MGKKKIDAITPAQTEALEALCRFADEKGYPPTVMELSAILGISQASAYDRINQLVSKGYLRREDCKARGLTVTNRTGEIAMELVPVPIIGAVAAGQPIFAEENFTGEVLVDSQKVRSGRHFALHVSGKSMIGAGIDTDVEDNCQGIPKNKLQQALGHPNTLKNKHPEIVFTPVFCSRIQKFHDSAKAHTEGLLFISQDDMIEFSKVAIGVVSKLWRSYTEESAEKWYSIAVREYQEKLLDPCNILSGLKVRGANDFEVAE